MGAAFNVALARRFAVNLVNARENVGLSQEELGFRSSLHRTEVSMLERGVRLPRIDTLVKLAGALEVPPGELLVGLRWTPGSTVAGRFLVGDEETR